MKYTLAPRQLKDTPALQKRKAKNTIFYPILTDLHRIHESPKLLCKALKVLIAVLKAFSKRSIQGHLWAEPLKIKLLGSLEPLPNQRDVLRRDRTPFARSPELIVRSLSHHDVHGTPHGIHITTTHRAISLDRCLYVHGYVVQQPFVQGLLQFVRKATIGVELGLEPQLLAFTKEVQEPFLKARLTSGDDHSIKKATALIYIGEYLVNGERLKIFGSITVLSHRCSFFPRNAAHMRPNQRGVVAVWATKVAAFREYGACYKSRIVDRVHTDEAPYPETPVIQHLLAQLTMAPAPCRALSLRPPTNITGTDITPYCAAKSAFS